MPLTARTGETIVYAGDAQRGGEFRCTGCNWPMVLRRGVIKVVHFAHKPNAECDHGPETIEHLTCKAYIYEQLRSTYGERVSVEHRVGDSIADVYVAPLDPGEFGIAVEVQHSPLTVPELRRRMAKYWSGKSPCLVVWVWGNAHRTYRGGEKNRSIRLTAAPADLITPDVDWAIASPRPPLYFFAIVGKTVQFTKVLVVAAKGALSSRKGREVTFCLQCGARDGAVTVPCKACHGRVVKRRMGAATYCKTTFYFNESPVSIIAIVNDHDGQRV